MNFPCANEILFVSLFFIDSFIQMPEIKREEDRSQLMLKTGLSHS